MHTNSHIVLLGPRGSGKSTVGRLLAEQLGRAFVDLDDAVIASAGRNIATIFKAEGEKRFRDREEVALHEALRRPAAVIATGGGVVVREANRTALQSTAHRILLLADEATLEQRMKTDSEDDRPALPPGNTLADRLNHYRELATIEVDTTNKSADEVAVELVAKLP